MPRLWSLIALLSVVVVVSVATAASDADFFEAAFGLKTHLHHSTATTTSTTAVQDSTVSFSTSASNSVSGSVRRDELFALSHQKEVHRLLKMTVTSSTPSGTVSASGGSKKEKPGQFLGCAEFMKADSAMSGLQEEFGSGNVRTIVSYPESELVEGGFTCFLVQPTSSSVELLKSKREFLLAWFPLPASLKLSRGAHSQLEKLMDMQKSMTTADMSSLVNSELEVHLGNGGSKIRARSANVAESILAGLQSLSPASRDAVVTEFSSVMPHMKAWNSLASALQGEKHIRSESRYSRRKLGSDSSSSSCNFDKLVFKSNDEFLFITHMHELADPSCFATVLATVASEPDVVAVSSSDMYRPLLDLVGDLLHSGDPEEGRVYHDVGLNGTGVVVGLLDGGVDEYSCFFNNSDDQVCARSLPGAPTHDFSRRKVIQYTYDSDSIEDSENGHGTGMAGIICGESLGGGHPEHLGVAPGAKIALYDASTSSANIGPLSDNLDTYYDVAATTGAKLYSASWGNRYDDYVARDVVNDQYAVDNDFLLIAAVGNYQASANNKVFSPGRSKNALTVGSSGTSGVDDPNSLSYFSCTGPTSDGRFGVDILAHGVDVFAPKSSGSTTETCEVSSRTGTSSSTAAVAGAAALVQEYFQNPSFWAASCNQEYAFCQAGAVNPKTILVKTILIHSGQDVGNSLAYPGNEQGFGRVQLDEVLEYGGVSTAGLDLFIEEVTLSKNSVLNWTVVVASNTIPLKATIAWVDPANIVSASKQLLNDVDLRIVDQSGTITYGNNNAAGDSYNNVEMARIASPTPGIYTISVSIGALGSGSAQAVTLVVTSYGEVGDVLDPTGSPSTVPTSNPSRFPSGEPSGIPTIRPSGEPSSIPTSEPTHQPNYNRPSRRPIFVYTGAPVAAPTPTAPVATSSPVSTPVAAPVDKSPTIKPTINYIRN